jgi:hypothetical protein
MVVGLATAQTSSSTIVGPFGSLNNPSKNFDGGFKFASMSNGGFNFNSNSGFGSNLGINLNVNNGPSSNLPTFGGPLQNNVVAQIGTSVVNSNIQRPTFPSGGFGFNQLNIGSPSPI